MESWEGGAGLGTPGTGSTWGTGALDYPVAVRGNSFVGAGGDDSEVMGPFFGAGHQGMGVSCTGSISPPPSEANSEAPHEGRASSPLRVWTRTKTRNYPEPPNLGSTPTAVPGVALGEMGIRENFTGCYEERVDSPCASRCSCPSGWTGGESSGHPEIRWYHHGHDPQSGGNPHIIQVDTCACSPCTFIPVIVCPDCGESDHSADTDGDGEADASEAEAEAEIGDVADFSTEDDGTDSHAHRWVPTI